MNNQPTISMELGRRMTECLLHKQGDFIFQSKLFVKAGHLIFQTTELLITELLTSELKFTCKMFTCKKVQLSRVNLSLVTSSVVTSSVVTSSVVMSSLVTSSVVTCHEFTCHKFSCLEFICLLVASDPQPKAQSLKLTHPTSASCQCLGSKTMEIRESACCCQRHDLSRNEDIVWFAFFELS